jgi:hypothetical protein
MKGPRIYLVYGLALLGFLGWAEYRGWSWSDVNETRDGAPRSVRDNPGANRPIYGGTSRYRGGK